VTNRPSSSTLSSSEVAGRLRRRSLRSLGGLNIAIVERDKVGEPAYTVAAFPPRSSSRPRTFVAPSNTRPSSASQPGYRRRLRGESESQNEIVDRLFKGLSGS